MLSRKLFVLSLLLTAAYLVAPRHAAAQSCPNVVTFGAHPASQRAAGETRRLHVTGVYFKTTDPSAFIPEGADRTRNSGVARLNTSDFKSKLRRLEQANGAVVNSYLEGDVFVGDTVELDLERDPVSRHRLFGEPGVPVLDQDRWFNLNRATTLYLKRRANEDFYRLNVLSYFVAQKDDAAQLTADLDAQQLIGQGETIIYKFLSDYELARAGAGRTYLALFVEPVGGGE